MSKFEISKPLETIGHLIIKVDLTWTSKPIICTKQKETGQLLREMKWTWTDGQNANHDGFLNEREMKFKALWKIWMAIPSVQITEKQNWVETRWISNNQENYSSREFRSFLSIMLRRTITFVVYLY